MSESVQNALLALAQIGSHLEPLDHPQTFSVSGPEGATRSAAGPKFGAADGRPHSRRASESISTADEPEVIQAESKHMLAEARVSRGLPAGGGRGGTGAPTSSAGVESSAAVRDAAAAAMTADFAGLRLNIAAKPEHPARAHPYDSVLAIRLGRAAGPRLALGGEGGAAGVGTGTATALSARARLAAQSKDEAVADALVGLLVRDALRERVLLAGGAGKPAAVGSGGESASSRPTSWFRSLWGSTKAASPEASRFPSPPPALSPFDRTAPLPPAEDARAVALIHNSPLNKQFLAHRLGETHGRDLRTLADGVGGHCSCLAVLLV